jgi:hypothetical protein
LKKALRFGLVTGTSYSDGELSEVQDLAKAKRRKF